MNDEHREDASVDEWSSRSNGTGAATAEVVDRRWFEEALRAQGFLVEPPTIEETDSWQQRSAAESAPLDDGEEQPVVGPGEATLPVAEPAAAAGPDVEPWALAATTVTEPVVPPVVAPEPEPWELEADVAEPVVALDTPTPEGGPARPAATAPVPTAWPAHGATPERLPSTLSPAAAGIAGSVATRQAVAPSTLPAGRPPVPTPELAARLARGSATAPVTAPVTAPAPVSAPVVGEVPAPTLVLDTAPTPTPTPAPTPTLVLDAAVAQSPTVEVVTAAPEADLAPAPTTQDVAPETISPAPLTETPIVPTIVADPATTLSGAEAPIVAAASASEPPGPGATAADPWTLPALQADLAAEREQGATATDRDLAPFAAAAAAAPVVAAGTPTITPPVATDVPDASTAEAIARHEADLQAQGATDVAPVPAPAADESPAVLEAPTSETPVTASGPSVGSTAGFGGTSGDVEPTARAAATAATPRSSYAAPVAGTGAVAQRPPSGTVATTADGGQSDLWGLVGDPAEPAASTKVAPAKASRSQPTTIILTVFVALVVVVLVLGFIYLFTNLL